ncbi:MAG: glycoside hydrolase family 3 C-terminal domain-containing protein [Anaerolineaceae bacterium]|nr:glycoside hydrolase family 3 C-terminal domain-containing protein [Anaerolineaceae bacterium]
MLVFENTPDPIAYSKDLVTHPDHIALAQETAEKSMVLIKNAGQILLFRKDVKRVLVMGKLADQENTGDHGSSRVYPPYVITPLQGLRRYFGDAVEVLHRDESQLSEARQLAKEVDCVIVIAGNDYNDEGEYTSPSSLDEMFNPIITGYQQMGKPFKAALVKLIKKLGISTFQIQEGMAPGGDRHSLSLKAEQIRMIENVADANPNTVVCLVTGSMIMIDAWAKNIPGILHSWYTGMEGGTALANILFGEVNPSGKLPFSIPTSVEHLPYFSSTDKEITYDLYHGYTLLDKNGYQPAYPFGFGLTYTSFERSNLVVVKKDDRLEVSVTVSNTGDREGAEVV